MPAAPVYPSLALARIVGQNLTSRSEILAKLLRYVDARDLRDPTDHLTVILDYGMQAVFGRDRMTVAELDRAIGARVV